MKKYFLVYDDETKWFTRQRNNLLNSVKKFSDFETISFKKSEIDKDFLEKNKHIFQIPVGDGAWLWKPYIIDKTLEKLNDGDLLFYMDAKYRFVEEFENLYKNAMQERDILIWKNKPNEKEYPLWFLCHKHVLEKYGMLEKLYGNDEAKEPWAGSILIKKTPFIVSLIKEWLEMCQIKEDLWGDEESYKIQKHEYSENYRIAHRNDQSLLGILLYKYGIPMEYMEKNIYKTQGTHGKG
jgi:hypothetical protein